MLSKFFVVILCVYAVASASGAQHECKCHSVEALKRYNFESGSKKCANTSFLICCTVTFPNVAPSFNSFTSFQASKFCCFNYLSRIPNKHISECTPELIKYIDITSLPSNLSTFIHNITIQPLFQPSIEKSFLPNAIMLFFSLFFIFAYCFASLKKDFFRMNAIEITTAGYLHHTPNFIPPQPPHYESLPKDPPNYSSIFGPSHFPLSTLPSSSTNPSRQPSIPNYQLRAMQQTNNLQAANISEVFMDNVPNNTPNTPNNTPQNLSTTFIDTRAMTSLNQPQDTRPDPDTSQPEVSIYATPLSVIFLNEFPHKKHQNIAQKVKTMFSFLKDPKKKPEIVVSSSLMTPQNRSNDTVPYVSTPSLKPSLSLPVTSSPVSVTSQPLATMTSTLSPQIHDAFVSQQQTQQYQHQFHQQNQPHQQYRPQKQNQQQHQQQHQHQQQQLDGHDDATTSET